MPGIFTHSPPTGEQRIHQTEKPLALMRELVRLCESGGIILDPFTGSGSTLAAAVIEGYGFLGIEKDDYFVKVAMQRVIKAIEEVRDIEQGTQRQPAEQPAEPSAKPAGDK